MAEKKDTKQRILDSATELFNASGYGNISLQDIANAMEISRGNLTYHFASKDEILRAIFDRMWPELQSEREKSRQFPSFQNLKAEIALYKKYQRDYFFLFADSHVLSIPFIRQAMQEMANLTIEDNKAAIRFAIQMGNMREEPFPGAYHQLALTTWMLIFFWLPQKLIRGKAAEKTVEKTVWSMILPHFTSKGIEAFKQFYGEEFFLSIGPPFEAGSNEIILL